MACTTILVGKDASYDGSTIIARNDDSPSGQFTPKKFAVVQPGEQSSPYRSVLSHVQIPLPSNPLRYTCVPNALAGEGIWAASGVNAENVAMTATETITSNPRVLGADPLVCYQPAENGRPEVPGGIGEEDIVVLVLPYIHSAREGVLRLGKLLSEYGTYEMNGIAFQDTHEIWWMETIGGHHWIASKVPDNAYVVMPNQFGTDRFDLNDALGHKLTHLCSEDLEEFIDSFYLNLSADGTCNPREMFGSRDDADHVYNTPRAWFMERFLNPHTAVWDGPAADYSPESDNLPWCLVPEKKITIEDVKYVLSSHFQGTPYDPYGAYADGSRRGMYRSIGINRNDFLSVIQLRPYMPEDHKAIQWLAFASNAFNALVPLYTNINTAPAYLSNTGAHAAVDNFYWASRMLAALADAHYGKCLSPVERYQLAVQSKGHELIHRYDAQILDELQKHAASGSAASAASTASLCEAANQAIADMLQNETTKALDQVLYTASCEMKNSYARSDA